MAEFVNAKTPDFAEDTDMELTLDNLDGVSGGARVSPTLIIMEAGEGSPDPQTTDTTQTGTETSAVGLNGGNSVIMRNKRSLRLTRFLIS